MQWATCSRWPTAEVRAPAVLCYTVRSHGCGLSVNWQYWALFPNEPLLRPLAAAVNCGPRASRRAAASPRQVNSSIKQSPRLRREYGNVLLMFVTWRFRSDVKDMNGICCIGHFPVLCKKSDFTPVIKCEKPHCFQFKSSKTSAVLAAGTFNHPLLLRFILHMIISKCSLISEKDVKVVFIIISGEVFVLTSSCPSTDF